MTGLCSSCPIDSFGGAQRRFVFRPLYNCVIWQKIIVGFLTVVLVVGCDVGGSLLKIIQ